MSRLLLAILLLVMLSYSRTKAFNFTIQHRLQQQLLKDYDKTVVPSSAGNAVTVDVGASLISFEMHEQDHTLSMGIWIKLQWNDPRLKWDETEYSGIGKVTFEASSIWLPDFTLYSTADWNNAKLVNSKTRVVVMNSGDIIYVPPTDVKLPCFMDVALWPYDGHKCKLKLGSWVYDGYTVDVKVSEPAVQLEMTQYGASKEENQTYGEWILTDASLVRNSKYYECCEEPYVDITISMSFYRSAPAYCWTVMMPIAVLWLLTFVTFLLPPASGEKILVASLSLLANILFLDYTSRMIGHSPTHTPILVKLVCLQLVLMVLAVLLAALVLNISRGPHTLALPSPLKLPLLRLSTVLGLASYAHRVSRSDGADLEKSDRLELGEESNLCSGESRRACNCDSQDNLWNWLLLGAVIDRLCLILYLVIFIFSISFFAILV